MDENVNEVIQLTNNEIKNIFKYIQVDQINFELENNIEFVENEIVTIFDEAFLKIDSKELSLNEKLINLKFIDLITHFKQKYNYVNIGFIFIVYCDYFCLDYNKTYLCLHDKLKSLIKEYAKKVINTDIFKKYENAEIPSDYKVKNIFQLK